MLKIRDLNFSYDKIHSLKNINLNTLKTAIFNGLNQKTL